MKSNGSSSRIGTPKSKSRGKHGLKWYICVTCQSHFDTEEEIAHHEKLDSCFTLQPGSLQSHGHPGVGIGQFTTNEKSMANPVHDVAVIGLKQGMQRDGSSSVLSITGESSHVPHRQIYVSPYASPRLASPLGVNSRSSSKSISAQRVELTPSLSHATAHRHDTIMPHPDAKRSKSVRSDTSSVDSDLETTIPHALNEANNVHANSAPMQRFPSTATQPEEPFTQVKRTPYVNGPIHDKVAVHTVNYASSRNGRTNGSSFTIPTKRNGKEAPSHPSTPGIHSTKSSADQNDYTDGAENHPAQENENLTIIDETMVAQQNQAAVDAQSQIGRSVSPTKKQKLSAVKSIRLQPTSESTSSEPSPHKDDSSVTGVRSGFGLKHRSYEPALLSPNVAKRRKHFKASTAFQFTQDVQIAQDPSILARAYRQEFLASRKSSTSEQSDLSTRTLNTPEKVLDFVNQHNNQTVDVRDGNIVSNLEVNETSTNLDASLSVSSPLENIPPLMSEAENQSTIIGNDEDVVMTIEDQDVAINDVPLSSEALDTNVSAAVEDLNNQDNDDDNTVNAAEAQKCQEPDLASDSAPIEAKDNQICKTNEFASSPSGIGHQPAVTDLDSRSVATDFDENRGIYKEAASSGAQDGQGFQNQADASLSSGKQSGIHSNRDSLLESSTQVPVIVERDKAEEQTNVLMADAEPEISTKIHDAVAPQDKPAVESPPATPATVYERFKTTYPDYMGNEDRFIAICKKINALNQQDRMEHRSLWDDFIIRHMTEYPNYLQRCALNAEDPLPYERFYRNEIDEPNFTKRVVTPKNLREILGIGGQEDSAMSQQQPPLQYLPQRPDSTVHKDVSPTRSVKSPTRFVSAAVSTPIPPLPQATVDLTNDSDDSEPVQSARKRPRLLPWVSSSPNGVHSPPTPKPSLSNARDGLSPPPRTSTKSKPQPSRDGIYSSPKPGSTSACLSPPPRTSTRLKARSGKKIAEALSKGTDNENSSPATPKPSADTEQPEKTNPKDWWKDEDTPYKKFAKAYLSMRPGKGNAFAMSASKDASANTSDRTRSSKRNCVDGGAGR